MVEAILDAMTALLAEAGLNAMKSYPDAELPEAAGPLVCVGMRENRLTSPGAGDYMGMRDAGGAVREVYGYRMDTALLLDIYCPLKAGGAAACLEAAGEIAHAAAHLPSGLRLRAIAVDEAAYDAALGMFHMPVELTCAAFLTRERDEETGEFTDFNLRGVLKCQ